MLKKITNFIKYNNAVVFIVLFVFLIGSGVFAQSETGQEVIGQKQTRLEGFDNTLLLEADLDSFDMEFKIERIEEDEFYYYVTYTYLDLVSRDNTWQYQIQEKVRKVTKLLKRDLGDYIAEELEEQYYARMKDLRKEQKKHQQLGENKRFELSEYDGLIGESLELAAKVFPGYEPVKKKEIPSPSLPSLLTLASNEPRETEVIEDSITEVYNNYIAEMDPDKDDIFGTLDNCPLDWNPKQEDKDSDGVGDLCDLIDDSIEEDIEASTSDDILPDPEDTNDQEPVDTQDDTSSSTDEVIDTSDETRTASGTEESTGSDESATTEEEPVDTPKEATGDNTEAPAEEASTEEEVASSDEPVVIEIDGEESLEVIEVSE